MGDVLCKWRMPKVEHVVELVQELPKEEMAENEFKIYMSGSIYGEGFTRTAYQLACQLGLYCIDSQIYIYLVLIGMYRRMRLNHIWKNGYGHTTYLIPIQKVSHKVVNLYLC